MRRTLLEDVSELDIIINLDRDVPILRKKYRTATSDSGVAFPSMQEFRRENWGAWQTALEQQIENASAGQIVNYFAQAYGVRGAKDCPVCKS